MVDRTLKSNYYLSVHTRADNKHGCRIEVGGGGGGGGLFLCEQIK